MLLIRYCDGTFRGIYLSRIDVWFNTIKLDGDTADYEEFRNIKNSYYHGMKTLFFNVGAYKSVRR